MNMISTIGRGCDAAVHALRAEFGAVLAARIIEAEAVDFLWEARVRERYLGQQISWDFDDGDASQELSRISILSVLDGRWYVGLCLVDGEGAAVELLWKRPFECRGEAEFELVRAR
ncbi:hypothetical protein [Sphingosinicella sp. CPCC 101087]|uniref:hypothetical protein n=1 Tax=Sphingosinicella sp. CPCC 101087 TaxID=2497754 RepID=UPI00101BEF67|nr:hypothetical protein [Sphingosinicella sp. CPCC 101087]